MNEQLGGWKRTGRCAEFGLSDEGREVTLMGWVDARRDLGGLRFIRLRDRSGTMQVTFDQNDVSSPFEAAGALKSEFVIAVRGVVASRTKENVNPNMKTGEIEILARELKILSSAKTPPFEIDDNVKAREELRLKYRYLDLRRPVMQKNLILRDAIVWTARKYLRENGFLEIETPILQKSTPEGARDYLVPSRVHPGSFYALPQSPQIFKQLLMVSGFDRYFQIVKCFRDEDLRADRQPEFTQIDVEMSFVSEEDILRMMEGLMAAIFKACSTMVRASSWVCSSNAWAAAWA